MRIKDMFEHSIDREITGVVKVGQHDEKVKKEELEEYVVTRELMNHFSMFFERYARSINTPTDNMGVWISGFFGSGKSHFLKILSYILDNDTVAGKNAVDYFVGKSRISESKELLENMRTVSASKTKAILFNVDSKSEATGKSDSNAIVRVFNRVFNEKLGYIGSMPALADLERSLDEEGKYEDFQNTYESITGKAWLDDRHKFKLKRSSVKKTLVEMGYMTEEEATLWVKESVENYSIAIDDFAEKVAQYINRTGERIVFLVDEIGQFISKDSNLMLNLQTITEDLGNRCHGKAWIIVTSQEDIDAMTENIREDGNSSNDFSKIQGRFATRLSLSSVNADEVIRERILKKNEAGEAALREIYRGEEMTIKNVIDFDAPILLKTFENESEFADVYPFIPYQFHLLGDVLNGIRKNSSSMAHMSEGERSMLGAFQVAAKNVMDKDGGILIPFYRFFDNLVSSLDHTHSAVIQRAQDNVKINPDNEKDCFNVNVLKVLFLLKYVDGVPLTVKNIVSLMITDIKEDRAALKERVQEALRILENNLLISEMQGTYEFLTDEEQDINNQIMDRHIQMGDVIGAVTDMVYDQIYTNTRYKLPKFNGRYTFAINQSVDNKPRKTNQNSEIGVRILTPWYIEEGRANIDSRSALLLSAKNCEAVLLLPGNQDRYLKELRTALKIDDYIRNVADPQKGKSTVIRQVKIQESAKHKAEALALLKEAITDAEVFVNGHAVEDIKMKDASAKIGEAIRRLVETHYSKLSYITNAMEEADIRKLLDRRIIKLEGIGETEPNINAVKDVQEYIRLNTAGHMAISMNTINSKFKGSPYGYTDVDIQWLVAKIFKDGHVSATIDKEPITLFNRTQDELTTYFTGRRYLDKLMFLPKSEVEPKKIKAAKEVSKELFKYTETTDDPDRLQEGIRERSTRMQERCTNLKKIAETKMEYPGRDVLNTAIRELKAISEMKNQAEFFNKIEDKHDDLFDLAEDLDPVITFYESEQQRKIFDDYGLRALGFYNTSKEHIVDHELEEIVESITSIIEMSQPYGKLKDLPDLYQKFTSKYSNILEVKAEPVKAIIKSDLESLLDALEGMPYEEKYKDEIENKFNTLIDEVDRQNDISYMLGYKDKADSLVTQYLDRFDKEVIETEEDKEEGNEGREAQPATKPKTPQKITKNLIARQLTTTWRIEKQEDLDKHIENLKKQIEAQIEDGVIVKVQF